MIKDIQEINFPEYATLSQATVTLNDMGNKTISTQIKIDGGVAPDFSYDWEVEFQGERYIQPLREPQASKGNESICSVIDLVFQHKTIYELKRYYFAKMAEVQSGTVSVDKYIADLNVNLEGFCDALQEVLDYYFEIDYFEERITINLKGKGTGIYAQEPQYVQIQYTHIWDVVQKIYDLFGVRWSIEGREIKIGYPTEEVAHTFEYGFEGGLLKVERQVQSADIRNSLLGRGGSKNLPYLYFKDLDKYGETGENETWTPDPDAIPELRSIYFTELRGKTFRDYVQGWKTNPNRDLSYGDVVEEYDTERGESPEGWAYKAGHEDNTFNPIEYVEDKESIDKYGLLQGGLENQEDIYPTIQGVEVDGLGRVDEIVGARQVLVDEPTSEESQNNSTLIGISATKVVDYGAGDISSTQTYTIRTESYKVSKGRKGVFMGWYSAKGTENIVTTKETLSPPFPPDLTTQTANKELKCEFGKYKLFDANTNTELITSVISDDMEVYAEVEVVVSGFTQGYDNTHDDPWAGEVGSRMFVDERNVSITVEGGLSDTLIHGIILDNYEDGERISGLTTIVNGESSTVTIQSLEFEVTENGATNVDVPINIIVDKSGEGLYEFEKTVKAVNVDTNEVISSINIPQGKYYLRVSVDIRNNSSSTQTYKVELMPSYIYYPTDSEEFKPTFDIWVKNIWGTTRNEGESVEAYTDRVWTPILGDREGNEAKVVFTTGWLAGHSDYEFVIRSVEYAGGSGVELDGVPAEWKIELIKSDAEIEATGKWIPSTTQQAFKGDKFFFIGIDMPHEYTLWAEQAVDNYKGDQLLETAHIKPTWVVQTDKVRLNQLQPNETEPLLNALKIGNSLRLADTRFTNGVAQTLYLQSVTYTWQEGTNIVPDVEVVLSDKVTTSTNPVAKLQGEVDALTKQVGSISNIQQVVRAIGDKLYLRKDGFDEVSNSATEFNKLVSSRGYRQGAVGGNGWGLRSEQGKGIFEVDKLIVRDEMQVNSLVVNQVSAIGGKEIFSAASITCSRVETTEQGFKCYFDQKRGSVANLFQVNDIAYSQVFNANDIEVKYYKREVIEVGDNYILLSLDGDGNGMPQEGDVIVHFGNTTDLNRQYVIIRDVIGGGYERMLSDLNSVSASGVEYYFAGRLDGDTPRWFVGNNNQFIEYKDGHLQINADVTLGGGSDLSASEEFKQVQQDANDAKNEANSAKETADNALANAKSYTDQVAKGLQDQLDGKVESFFYDYDPTLDNIPASEWTTDELKVEHLNDTFTNTESGRSWRWLEKNGVYQWVEIVDTQSAEALAKAEQALGIANGKVAVFATEDTPKTPYNVGDLWLVNNRIKRSVETRTTKGETYINDWVFAEDSHEYTDNQLALYEDAVDTTVAELNNAIANAEANAKNYTDEGKVALQASIIELNNAKANIDNVYTKAEADGKIDQAESDALNAAQDYADAAIKLAEETTKAYADGKVSEEEASRIAQAKENLEAAKEHANEMAFNAESNAQGYTDERVEEVRGEVAYLKTAFPLGTILNVNGVTLSSFVGVKGAQDNVVAGMYGGASPVLNQQGYQENGDTIMVFAGMSSASDIKNAKTKIFASGKFMASEADIRGTVTAISGQIGEYIIGESSVTDYSTTAIESNNMQGRVSILPYFIEFAAKRLAIGDEGEEIYEEYGTLVKIGGQLGNGYTTSNQISITTNDVGDSMSAVSYNASIRIDCYNLSKYEAGDPSAERGNHAIMIDRGNVCGFRIQTRRLQYSQDLTLRKGSTTATVKNANLLSKYDGMVIPMESMTLVLPHDAEDGQIYYIKPYSGTTTVIVNPLYTHKIMSQREEDTTKALSSGAINIFIFDEENNRWHHGYLQ